MGDTVIKIGRKSKLLLAVCLLMLLLTCYFCWEILYQERAILGILRVSKFNDLVTKHNIDMTKDVDHLEEIVDSWLQSQKKDMIDKLRQLPAASAVGKQ